MCQLEGERDECLPVVGWRWREVDGRLVQVVHRPSAGGELIERRPVVQERDNDEDLSGVVA